ncbi:hypothetical protein ABEB36_013619 [Hypothenemus hampei]|uniref:THAP-type domain-containing protein n=1 Tax=Hypothenemus hampei TaxID=57062 RepID=A0ABD1E6W6_HYPHA
MRCAVFGCNEDDQAKDFKRGEVRFYRFPTDPVILKAWRNACWRKDNFNTANARVCSKHFKKTDYARDLKCELLGYNPKNRRLLKPVAVPTENIINNPTSSFSVVSASTSQRIVGIIITNTSLKLLYQDLLERFGIKFILTYRLNQDKRTKMKPAIMLYDNLPSIFVLPLFCSLFHLFFFYFINVYLLL